ncbi:ABC transporter substrate-binding protein, partial [Paenibacillus sepulcri]|nr:ABC transporter substrate-binding protein [Paenibacillus sepulcri]
MKKRVLGAGLIAIFCLSLAACGGAKNENSAPASGNAVTGEEKATNNSADQKTEEPAANETRTIHYLDQDYTVPAKTDKIVITGSFEAMEDALVLGVQPIGASTIGGKFPDMFTDIMGSAKPIGEKIQPNMETILTLKPDVILGSSKFKPEVSENLAKIAPTMPVSHISTNWEANLRL